jgi:hypothetical protein
MRKELGQKKAEKFARLPFELSIYSAGYDCLICGEPAILAVTE